MLYKEIAVVGSNGFIGRHLVRHLAMQEGLSIRLFGRAAASTDAYSLPYTCMDVTQEQDFPHHFSGVDLVYYLASGSIPSSTWASPEQEVQLNLLPFLRFLTSVAACGVKKVVFVSSAGTIYGPTDEKVTEISDKNPFNPHGIIKLTMEYFLNYFNNKEHLGYDIYRVANVYGEGQNTGKGLGIINTFLENILDKGEVNIFGDGENVRNYIYVDDLARILLYSLNSPPGTPEVFNVASGDNLSINELVAVIRSVVDHDFKANYTPKRQSDNPHIYIDNAKLISRHPELLLTPISKGIRETYNAIKANRDSLSS